MKRISRKLLESLKAFLIPVLVYVLFGLLSGGRMFNTRTFLTTLRTAVQPALICYALFLGMKTGMMNFSAGAIVVCAAIIGNGISNILGWGLAGFALFALLTALACSMFLASLYTLLHVPCVVLSLGMTLFYEAFPRLFFPGGAVISQKNAFLAQSPYIFLIVLLAAGVFFILYNKTTFGHNIRAIGANQPVALAAGLNLDKIKFANFTIGGIFLGIAGIIYLSNAGKVENVSALGSMSVMMDGFMGVFLGMLLARWADPSLAVFLGVFTMKILSTGFVAVGISATWKDVVTGAFMLIIMTVSANAALPEAKRLDRLFALEADRERK